MIDHVHPNRQQQQQQMSAPEEKSRHLATEDEVPKKDDVPAAVAPQAPQQGDSNFASAGAYPTVPAGAGSSSSSNSSIPAIPGLTVPGSPSDVQQQPQQQSIVPGFAMPVQQAQQPQQQQQQHMQQPQHHQAPAGYSPFGTIPTPSATFVAPAAVQPSYMVGPGQQATLASPDKQATANCGPGQWVCSQCTLINDDHKGKCDVCGNERPGGAVGPWVALELTQMEYDHYCAVFYRFLPAGSSDNGELGPDELEKLCRFLNFAQTEEQIAQIFYEMGRSRPHTRKINQQEFVTWLARHRPDPRTLYSLSQPDYHSVLFLFNKYDADKNGSIDRNEFVQLAMHMRYADSPQGAVALFNDINGGREITLHNLLVHRANSAVGRGVPH